MMKRASAGRFASRWATWDIMSRSPPRPRKGCESPGSNSLDVVVLDVRLPGMDGLTAMRSFRERIGHVPIIIITAFGNLETAVRALEGGAFDYLVKPFDLDQATTVVKRALEKKQSREPAAGVLAVEPRPSSGRRRPCKSCSRASRWSRRPTCPC